VPYEGFVPTLARWWWVLLVGTVAAAAAGSVVASRIAPVYEAEVRLLVGPVNADADTLKGAGALALTYAELVTSTPVLSATGNDLSPTIPAGRLRSDVRASANEITRIITITARDTNRPRAVLIANKLADKLAERTAGTPIRPGGMVSVVQPAEAPSRPVEPKRSIIIALAGLSGLLVGLGVAMVSDRLRDRISSPQQLMEAADLPVVISVWSPRGAGRLDFAKAAGSATAAAYRLLATYTEGGAVSQPVQRLLVASCFPGEASGEVAANLATTIAAADRDVTVVDLNVAEAAVTCFFGLKADPGGLSRVKATPGAPWASAVVDVGGGRTMKVVPCDPLAGQLEVTASVAGGILNSALSSTSLVIVNATPLSCSTDAIAWASAADAVILVARRDRTRRTELAIMATSLRSSGKNLAVGVLVEAGWSRKRVGGRALIRTDLTVPTHGAASVQGMSKAEPGGANQDRPATTAKTESGRSRRP
jgi:capsular polysaccharide biosynthesis protein